MGIITKVFIRKFWIAVAAHSGKRSFGWALFLSPGTVAAGLSLHKGIGLCSYLVTSAVSGES